MHSTLYEVPTAGGESKRVLEDVGGPITFSPDGGRFAFVRYVDEDEGASVIMLANTDGSEEREIARHKYPEFFEPFPAWSPDGRSVACPAGSMAGEGYANVVEVQVENGAEKPLSPQRWGVVNQVVWLSDGSGLMMVAGDEHNGAHQIWNLSYPAGELRKVTNDLNNYARLSVTADSKRIVTARQQMRTDLFLVPGGDAGKAELLTDASTFSFREICWSPDGRIVFPDGGKREISIMNADGTGFKQLTTDGRPKYFPLVSPDGRYIVFMSMGADTRRHIWRVDADGSNLTQLTGGAGENFPSCSPDGWVIYTSGGPKEPRLWKVPIEGGEARQLTDKPSRFPKVSPDGKLIACGYRDSSTSGWKTAIIPFEGGPPIQIFDTQQSPYMRWMPDGRALNYIVDRNGAGNIWSQPVEGGPPRQVTNFGSLSMYGFDWSRDGRLICSRGFSMLDLVLITDSQ